MEFENTSKLPHPFSDMDEQKKALTLLLVSDIHLDTKKLEKLKLFFIEKFHRRVHYVLAPGDFDNLDNLSTKPSFDTTFYENISNILSFLEFASVPVIYIPGNHDSPKLFKEKVHLTQHSILAQKEAYELTEGLQIVGLGGSVPGVTESQGQTKEVWRGYPYSNDSDFNEDLKKVMDKHCCNEDVQTILMTHVGPYASSTTIDMDNPDIPIYSGSKSLQQAIGSGRYNVLANIHGHTHSGVGKTNLRGIPIINPGSLTNGDFAVVELVRENVRKKWIVKQTEFVNLNAF